MSKFNSTSRSLAQILREDSRTVTDPAFERPFGCWLKKQEQSFLKSLFEGHMCSPITRANVQECLQHSRSIGDTNSMNYFKNKASIGASWVSLDGKHRRETIRKFLENKISYTGKIFLASGKSENYTNTYFNKMTEQAQASIMNIQIVINDFVSITRKELPTVFIGLNSGSLPTDQHLRNASDSPLAGKTREIHEKFSTVFSTMCNDKMIAAMVPEEIISKMLLHLESKERVPITASLLSSFYNKGNDVGSDGVYSSVYSLSAEQNIKTILSYMENIISIKRDEAFIGKNSILYFLVLEKVIENNLKIVDVSKFVDSILLVDSILDRESRRKMLEDEESGEEISSNNYYVNWIRQKWAGTHRYERQELLWDSIEVDISRFGLSNVKSEIQSEDETLEEEVA